MRREIDHIIIENNFESETIFNLNEIDHHITEYEFIFLIDIKKREENPYIRIEWYLPLVDIGYMWHPLCGMDRSLKADWDSDISTMTAKSAPVFCFYNEQGKNRFTFALSEIKKTVHMNAGVHEENGMLRIKAEIPMKECMTGEEYRLSLYMNKADTPYYDTLNGVREWWESACGLKPMKVPEIGKSPMYSTWYSFHQEMSAEEIEAECKRAKEMGFDTIILDDGWQTDDNHRGYAYCGDWQPTGSKFPDMADHVAAVHDIGMKYMIWFSVPFVGIHADNWNTFAGKLLYYNETLGAGVLDLRYKEVRDYLINVYTMAVSKWYLDGIKLDFIDEFYVRTDTKEYEAGMDYHCVQEALDCFMTALMQQLVRIKPDILVEFRQKSIGPNMRKYGNIFRVNDCPNSALSNRVGSIDLRLLSGRTAVHSDMIMWNQDETAEGAARHILNSIFATMQLSVKLENITDRQKRMVCFWVDFQKRHQELLQDSVIRPYEPQNLYPVVEVKNDRESIIALYSTRRIVELDTGLISSIIINATKEIEVVVYLTESLFCRIIQRDCCGEVLSDTERVLDSGYSAIPVTESGMLQIMAGQPE